MADELEVAGGLTPEAFIAEMAVREPEDFLSRVELEQVERIFRGCGVMRKYAALVYLRNTPRATLNDKERFAQGCVSQLQADPDYVLDLAQCAEMESDIFGPFSADPARLSKAITMRQAREFAKLDTPKQRKEAYNRIQELAGAAGKGLMRDTTNVVQHILKQAEAKAAKKVAAKAPETPEAPAAVDVVPADYNPFEDDDTAPATVSKTDTPKPAVKSGKAPKDEPITGDVEEFPWSQTEEALQTALTWAENKEFDGDSQWRMEVAERLCEFAELIRRSK